MVPLLLITIPFSISVVNAGSCKSTDARICRRNAGRLSAEPFHLMFVGFSLSVTDVPTISMGRFQTRCFALLAGKRLIVSSARFQEGVVGEMGISTTFRI